MFFDFGNNNKNKATSSSSSSSSSASSKKRLNIADIKEEQKKQKKAGTKVSTKPSSSSSFSFSSFFGGNGSKPSSSSSVDPGATRIENGKLTGYFSEEQLEALIEARKEVPSNAFNYWNKIADMVPGQTPATCKQMANQLALDKARGTSENFFKEVIEVKEPEMYIDDDASVVNRLGLGGFFGKK
jgi:hypothetical protein